MTDNLVVVDPKSPLPAGKKEAAFIAITAWSPLYKDYEDPGMSDEYKQALFPVVLMNFRWDGKFGFIGGFKEEGMTLSDTVVKEAAEEAGLAVDLNLVKHVVTHENDRLRLHLYHLNAGVLPLDSLIVYCSGGALSAKHAICEGSVVWAHLADYGRGKGWETLLNGQLTTAVKEELIEVRSMMMDNPPDGAYLGPETNK